MITYNKKFFRAGFMLFMICILQLGSLPFLNAQGRKEKTQHTITNERSSHKYSYKSSSTSGSFSIDYRGEITLTDDEKDIKSITPGGYFKVSKTTFGTKRVVKIENKGDDQLIRAYYVGRNKEPYYPDGQKWLADILPEIIRETGLGAAQRAARIYRKSGTEGVLNEIDLINSDYVKAKYFSALMDMPGIPQADMPKILSAIGTEMDSSYEMGKLLSEHNRQFLRDEASAKTFFRTASKLSSDYEKSKLLIKVLDNPGISKEVFGEALNAAGSISSDYESGKVLKSVLNSNNLKDDELEEVMEMVDHISSDYEKSKVLLSLMDRTFNDRVFQAVLDASEDISSDYERSKVLKQLINHQDLDNSRLKRVLNAVEDMSSDYEKKNTIIRLIDDHQIDGENIPMLLDMVDDMSSSYEQSNIFKKVIDEVELSDENMVLFLGYIENISSDYEKTSILVKIGEEASKRGETVKSAYLEAAKSVNSDHSYGRIMRAFDY